MVAKTEDVLVRLRSHDPDKRLKAVKDVKNKIIGNQRQKTVYIRNGAVNDILQLLQSSEDSQLLVQCAACAGSFARCEEGVDALLDGDGPAHLGRSLANTDSEVVRAAARSLHAVYQSEDARDRDGLAAAPLETLADLLKTPDLAIAEMAARLLALLCETTEQRQQALHLGCHESLVLLLLSKQDSVKHAAIAGLAVLTACQSSVFEPAFCTTLMKEGLRLITGGQCPVAAFQLDACYSIVHVCMRQQQESSILVLQHRVLPVLLRLLADTRLRQDVPPVLSHLLELDGGLAVAAVDADVMHLLCQLLIFFEQWSDACLIGVMGALEQIFEHHRDAQAEFVDDHEWPALSHLLMRDVPQVRIAACTCLRKLFSRARPVNACRCQLDHHFAANIRSLVQFPDLDVRISAVRLVSVLLVHNSLIKEQLLQQNIMKSLAVWCRNPNNELRLAAATAVLNAAADVKLWEARPDLHLANEIHAELVTALCTDAVPEIRAAAYGILQNYLQIFQVGSESVKHWYRSSSSSLLEFLVQQLLAEQSTQAGHASIVPLLYGLTNAAALGDEAVKAQLMSSKLPTCLPTLLRHAHENVITAALWLLISLIERSPSTCPESQLALKSRRDAFIQMDISVPLTICMDSLSADVRNRALTAICSLDVPESDNSE